MDVTRGSTGHVDTCLDIAKGLGDFFNDDAMRRMTSDLREHDLYVADGDDGKVAGFLAILHRSPDVVEISWMGVRTDLRGRGIGTALVDRAVEDLAAEGASMLMVHTLADTVDYEPYEATRAFYLSRGLKHLETVDPYPGAAPGNPLAIYVRVLR